MLEARIKLFIFLFKRGGSLLYFDVLHVQIFIQQNILGAMKFYWKSSKMLPVAGNFFQKLWRGKSLKGIFLSLLDLQVILLDETTMEIYNK